jgi:uncharacterized protein (DUF2062 family)
MAHAGTPTDLSQQPATSSVNRLWQAAIAAILVVALAAGIVAAATTLAAKPTAVPATTQTYQIQMQPGLDTNKVVGHKGALIDQ